MKLGTIVRNLYQPSYESLLVYMGVSGEYAKCLWIINGKFHGMHKFYKRDILKDRENFPIVGHVDYKTVIVDAVKKGLCADKEEP